MPHCEACPVPPCLPCLGEDHAPACDDVRAGRPGRADQLLALATGSASPRLAGDAELAMRVDTCPDGQSGDCGCDGRPRDCRRPGRPAKVPRSACFDCQSGDWGPDVVESLHT